MLRQIRLFSGWCARFSHLQKNALQGYRFIIVFLETKAIFDVFQGFSVAPGPNACATMTNPPRYEVEPAQAGDLPRIVDMKLAMFAEAGHASLLAPGARERILDDYQRLYASADAQHFVVRIGAAVVACAGAFVKTDLPFRYFDPPVYGFLGDVYTEPALRGRGLARQVNQHALLWLAGKGIRMVRLLASEAGRPLYTQLGFVASDEMVLVDRA
jgi:GNAT superfamily N-acetyltransferase